MGTLPCCGQQQCQLLPTALLALLASLCLGCYGQSIIYEGIGPGSGPKDPNKPVNRISILGERHSGTNYVEMLLRRNLDSRYTIEPVFFEFKHSFQLYNSSNPLCDSDRASRTLVVIVVRNPYDWALAMHRVCYHCRSRESMPFEQFVSSPWEAPAGSPSVLANETQDYERDVFNGDRVFPNIMRVRAAKYANFFDVARRYANGHELVRHEDILLPVGAAGWLQGLAYKHGIQMAHNAPKHVAEYKQEPDTVFHPRQHAETSLYLNRKVLRQRADLASAVTLIKAYLDKDVEGRLGYPILYF